MPSLLAIALSVLTLGLTGAPAQGRPDLVGTTFPATVVAIIDGDTIDIVDIALRAGDDGRMPDEMAQNQLRELLVEFEGRLNQRFDRIDERFNRVDQRLDGLSNGQHSLEAAIASVDTRLSARIAELRHSMTVQFEKSHANMKLGLEAVQILDERMDRRFGEQDARLQEQIDLLKAVGRR